MPLYRDDRGNLYYSLTARLRGEVVRPSPIRMPENAWLRVAQVKPEWVERVPRAALVLVALSVLLLLALVPLWLLLGPLAGTMALLGVCLILNIGYHLLLAMAVEQVPMDRPLSLIHPQPRGLIALELLFPWSGVLLPASLGWLLQMRVIDGMPVGLWLLLFAAVAAVGVLVLNVRFVRHLRRGAAGIRVVG